MSQEQAWKAPAWKTPRTDALLSAPADVLFAHACQLERELNEARTPPSAERATVYQCPQCGAGMEVDPTAKPSTASKVAQAKSDDEILLTLENLWCQYTGGHLGGSEFNEMVCDVIAEQVVPRHFDRTAPSATKWISTDERLPEERIRVLGWDGLCIEDCFYGVSSNRSDADWSDVTWRRTGYEDHHRVTHWMPLPEAPRRSDSSTRLEPATGLHCGCPVICDSQGCRPVSCKGPHTPGCQRAPDIHTFVRTP